MLLSGCIYNTFETAKRLHKKIFLKNLAHLFYHIIPDMSLCKIAEYTAPFLCRENKGHFYLCKNLTNGRLRGILYSKEQMFGKEKYEKSKRKSV